MEDGDREPWIWSTDCDGSDRLSHLCCGSGVSEGKSVKELDLAVSSLFPFRCSMLVAPTVHKCFSRAAKLRNSIDNFFSQLAAENFQQSRSFLGCLVWGPMRAGGDQLQGFFGASLARWVAGDL